MKLHHLLYHLKQNKILLWIKDENNLSFSCDINAPFSEYLKSCLQQNKAELLNILSHNHVNSEEISKNIIFYRIPAPLRENIVSSIQKGIYLQSHLDKVKHTYNVPLFIHFKKIDISLLKKAIIYIIEKYPILRMSMCDDIQYKILALEEFQVTECEVAGDHAEALCQEKSYHEFKLNGGKLINTEIIKIKNSTESILNLTHHHILSDAYSLELLTSEILSAYIKLYQHETLDLMMDIIKPDYFDYVAYQDYLLQTENYKMAITNLTNKLEHAEILKLKKTTQMTFDHQGDAIDFVIDTDVTKKLKQLSIENDVSLYAVLLTSLYHVLSVYSGGQINFPIGLTVSNRPFALNKIIGPFINTLPLVPEYNPNQNFIDNIKKINQELIYLNEYQQINLTTLTKNLERDHRDISDLTHVMFTMHNFSQKQAEYVNQLELEFEIIKIKQMAEKSGLSFVAKENGTELVFNINYAKSLFQRNYIRGITKSFILLLSKINTTILQKPLTTIDLLDQNQYEQMIHIWNQTDKKYPDHKTISQCFEEQVEKTPGNIALIFAGVKLTYRQLNEKSNQLAYYLKQTINIESDTLIVLCLDRSEYVMIAILAILKAGGTYVPVDLNYPSERIQYILEDTNTKLVLTNTIHKEKLDFLTKKTAVLAIDSQDLKEKLLLQPVMNLKKISAATDLAYVIYTSGTTGQPKGVMIEHAAYLATIDCVKHRYFTPGKEIKTYSVTNTVFDIFGLEYGLPLLSGGLIVIGQQDFQQLNCSHYDFIQMTPSLCNLQIDYLIDTQHTKLFIGGEPLNEQLLNKILDRSIDVINFYGPTETTIWSTAKFYSHKEERNSLIVSLGKPFDNEKAYILDAHLNPLPIEAIGELCLGGVGLARGYLNQPELTKEKFISNPFQTEEEKKSNKNARLYKTGDLVRWLPNGDIEYIGRNDFQVKIKGHRIELGEVESALSSYAGIKQSVVIVGGVDGNHQYLIGYYVAENRLDEDDIIYTMRSKLPEYMVPLILIHLEKLPLTMNGKLDRRALPVPKFLNQDRYVVPRNEIENQACQILAEILNLPKNEIGIDDDFFKLGMDSIASIQFVSQLKQQLNLNINVADIFDLSTVQKIFDAI